VYCIALIYTLLICCAVVTALVTHDGDRRKAALKIIKMLTGSVISLTKARPSREGISAEPIPHSQATQQDRTGVLVALWVGVVTCVGVLVAAAASAHGIVMMGGMVFGGVATVITLIWLIRSIRVKPGHHEKFPDDD
jgi:hypothetical protein